uniref:Uncharacterized protein n=1 Tax=Streptomyces sp. NBC_00003 TaxID=2903608 RepID=A0AAU2VHP9_9ACTN
MDSQKRVGHVMDRWNGRLQLRPLDGGREWDVAPETVRPAPRAEVLSAAVALANQRSRRSADCRW